MTIRNYITAAWLVFAVSGLLLGWQVMAYLTNNIPDHILPLVVLLSGTKLAVPVAYTWTMRIGAISLVGLLGSMVALVGTHLYLKFTHNDITPKA